MKCELLPPTTTTTSSSSDFFLNTHQTSTAKIEWRSPRICTSVRHRPCLRSPLHDDPSYPPLLWVSVDWTDRGWLLLLVLTHVKWNVNERCNDGASRTTNALEAFHHSSNSLISCQHSSIWTLVTSLEKQQALTRNTINEIRRKTSFLHSAKEKKRNKRIMKLVSEYSLPPAGRLLRAIAYNYMLFFACVLQFYDWRINI